MNATFGSAITQQSPLARLNLKLWVCKPSELETKNRNRLVTSEKIEFVPFRISSGCIIIQCVSYSQYLHSFLLHTIQQFLKTQKQMLKQAVAFRISESSGT